MSALGADGRCGRCAPVVAAGFLHRGCGLGIRLRFTVVLAAVTIAGVLMPCAAHAASGTLVFSDSFSNLEQWFPQQLTSDFVGWSLDSGMCASPPYSVGHVGYTVGENSALYTKNMIDLTGATTATLKYKTWYNTDPDGAWLDVQVKTDEPNEWGWFDSVAVASYTGSSGGGFVDKTVDLTPFVGHKIDVFFQLTSVLDVDEYWIYNGGVRIDDVQLWKDGTGATTWGGNAVIGSVSRRLPTASSKTYRRKRGKATYTLSAFITDTSGECVPGAAVVLQTSKNGKTGWRNTYPLISDSQGVAWKTITSKKKGTTYYRWVGGGKRTAKQKIVVK
jgi:hypothetical protein